MSVPARTFTLRLLTLVWLMLLASLGMYAVVAFAVPLPQRSVGAPPGMALALGVVAAAIALASFAMRRAWIERPAREGVLDLDEPAALARFQARSIRIWVLCESIGVFGLVLCFLSGEPWQAVPFLAGSAALLWLHRPGRPLPGAAPSARDLARPDVKIG